MSKTIATAALAATFVVGSATAGDKWDSWLKEVAGSVQIKKDGIASIEKLRDAACTLGIQKYPARRDVCVASYNVVIARRQAERAELELWLMSKSLKEADKNKLLDDVANVSETNVSDKFTTNLWERVWEMFPAPRQAVQR